jgi:uncharacterized protein DUF4232
MPDHDRLERSLGEPGPRERGYRPRPLPGTLAEAQRERRGTGFILRSALLVGVAAGAAVVTLAVLARLPADNRAGGPGVSASAQASPRSDPSAPCLVSNLAIAPDPWGGAMGTRGTTILFRTVDSAGACTVSGGPAASIVDAGGRVLVRAPAVSGPPVQLGPGKVAELNVTWSNWCGTAPAQPLTLVLDLGASPIRIEVKSLDGGATMSPPPCLGPGESSAFSVHAIEASSRAFPEG